VYPTAIVALVEVNRSISDDIENSLSIEGPANIHSEIQDVNAREGNRTSSNGEQAHVEGQLLEINTCHAWNVSFHGDMRTTNLVYLLDENN
jgi:hypothetical protein